MMRTHRVCSSCRSSNRHSNMNIVSFMEDLCVIIIIKPSKKVMHDWGDSSPLSVAVVHNDSVDHKPHLLIVAPFLFLNLHHFGWRSTVAVIHSSVHSPVLVCDSYFCHHGVIIGLRLPVFLSSSFRVKRCLWNCVPSHKHTNADTQCTFFSHSLCVLGRKMSKEGDKKRWREGARDECDLNRSDSALSEETERGKKAEADVTSTPE